MKTLVYVLGETLGWFACVLGAAGNRHWLGVLVVGGLLTLHLGTHGERAVRRIVALSLVAILLGFCLDSLLILGGVYEPVRWIVPPPFTTVWLLALWVNFSLIVDVPLRRLQSHLVVAAALGGLFGPIAYLAGQRLGALRLAEPAVYSLAALAVAWAVGMAVLMLAARHLPSFGSSRMLSGR